MTDMKTWIRTRRLWIALTCLALVALPALVPVAAATQVDDSRDAALLEKLRYPKTVVLVRHTEKSTDDPRDPNLSEAGVLRAQALARTLEGAGVTHLYASEFKRTQQTLGPISLISGAAVQIISARDPRATISAIGELPRGSVVVVAGHSNTVPALVAELVGKEQTKLSESDYDRLYVVTLWGVTRKASVLELRYGE